MKSKFAYWAPATIVILALAAMPIRALAQDGDQVPSVHLSGQINDYTPQSGGGPWEIRGEWSLHLNQTTMTANFSAAVNMTRSDYWVVLNPTAVNDNTSTGRSPHTHHITLRHATVIPTSGGFEVSGPVTVTVNGNPPPPFPASCDTCMLTVDITGGSLVTYSNITMKFSGPPSTHFGTQAIHGVVVKTDH